MVDKLTLQPRLQMLADLTPDGCSLADVGTDHGYLPVWLLQNGRICRAIASDINEEPLQHARETAQKYGVHENLEFRLGAGLDVFCAQDADTVIIAGMGGETIVTILNNAPWVHDANITLILQAMTKQELLRQYLIESGFEFTKERLVWDKGHLYPIYIVRPGEKGSMEEWETYAGVCLDEDPLYVDYLNSQMQRLQKAADGMQKSSDETKHAEAEKLLKLCEKIKGKRDSL